MPMSSGALNECDFRFAPDTIGLPAPVRVMMRLARPFLGVALAASGVAALGVLART